MALAWNAGWVNALRGSNPLSSATKGQVERLIASDLAFLSDTAPPRCLSAELCNPGPTDWARRLFAYFTRGWRLAV